MTNRLIMAAKDAQINKVAIAGGVAANSALRQTLKQKCDKEGFSLYIPPIVLCTDNAAMIGAQAYYEYKAGNTAHNDLNASANAKF